MFSTKILSRNMALAGAFTFLLGSSAFAQYGSYPGTYRAADRGYANRVVEGTVASVAVARYGERIRLTNGMDLVVPNSVTAVNQGRRYGAATLLPGDVVRMTVYSREGDGRDARVLSFELLQSNSNSYFGNDRRMSGTIVSFDRRNRSMVVQTDRGRTVSVDLSTYNGRMSWDTFRRGDRVSITGRMDRGNVFVEDIRVDNRDRDDQYDHRR
ncbi:MAG TPA: hypothetical protein VNN25_08055 [Thermoanaerobaculia bacterium]|nr:hypothetical protein [Thermoanaerobaculia bacterium]